MATPRRRVVRPLAVAAAALHQRQRRVQALRARLARDRTALSRWMSRLRRSFHTVERLQVRVSRADREIARLEES
ncbi:MAG TPA: hypothetical protein VH120_17780 [Gemmataceae bacterium]|jgi:hypothetical protein|nr:hypothetical protein [Gemmataceae bacterium]